MTSKTNLEIDGAVEEVLDCTIKQNKANETGYLYFANKYIGKRIKVLVMRD